MPSRADLMVFAAAIGLAAGSKYAGAALALPFAAVGAIALVRRRRAIGARDVWLALAIVLASGGFWYARNILVTGNPLYPVAVPGLPLPALYGGAEMRAWEYHLPVADLGALGATLLGAGIGFASAAAVATARLWRGLEAPLLAVLLAMFWFVIPYQESRFLFAAFGVGAIALARAADRPPALIGWCGLAIAIVGSMIQEPKRERLLLLPVGVAAAALASMARRRLSSRATMFASRAAVAAAVIAALSALAVAAARAGGRDPGYTVAGDDDLAASWAWFRANVRDTDVAYAGTNLAFPLAGVRLGNRVAYVNVAGAPGDRLHDFGPPGDGTAEPAPYRRGARPDAWLANLRATRTRVLFVAALYPIVRRTIGADRDGFPIERAWADARPGSFRLLHASAAARVYSVALP